VPKVTFGSRLSALGQTRPPYTLPLINAKQAARPNRLTVSQGENAGLAESRRPRAESCFMILADEARIDLG